ncbi:MAG: hypothetical protein KIC66_00525 [Clostridium sp.]|uniref:Uncharacterized protein n=1 Tax=Clostridium paraputrificum TaxID=29363 RepID=A0A6N3EXR4_9CLOT|nr:hypothetical protein [Clostridium sp.]MBS5925555.1 hypothetical protein [Clostridium sp.]MBS5986882.1 hypothetical protein [Clostridium sp.]
MEKNNNDQNQKNNESSVSEEELFKQLNILNISYDSLLLILVAIILNIEFVSGERAKLLDQLNNTNISDSLPDLSRIPIISNEIFLLVTSIFLFINYDAYETSIEDEVSQRDQIKAFRAFISSFLVLVATSISRGNLEV